VRAGIMPGSVCRHLKIAGRGTISRFFHITNEQPVSCNTSSRPTPSHCSTLLDLLHSLFLGLPLRIALPPRDQSRRLSRRSSNPGTS